MRLDFNRMECLGERDLNIFKEIMFKFNFLVLTVVKSHNF